MAAGFLALASLFFYGWWSIEAMPLLLAYLALAAVLLVLALAPGHSGHVGRPVILVVCGSEMRG